MKSSKPEDSHSLESRPEGAVVPEEPKPSAWAPVIGGVSAVVTMQIMQGIEPATRIKLFAGGLAGLLVGLVPMFLERRKGQEARGAKALGFCALWGVVGGLILAVPAGVYFSWRAWGEIPDGDE